MAKKIVWLVVSCLMAVSLVVASCGPAAEEEEEEGAFLPPDEPKYGGVLNLAINADTSGFDPYSTMSLLCTTLNIGHEELLTGDWCKGPAGTGETDWKVGNLGRVDVLTGEVAESYELPDDETIIWHIRKGIHWQDKPPANGRELTAEDVAWNITQEWTAKGTFLNVTNAPPEKLISAKATDKYTVECKVPAHVQGLQVALNGERVFMMCPDVYEEYGDATDWKNDITTAPFLLKDFSPGTSVTFEKNPNFWGKDPCGKGKGNQLPYMDGVKFFVIADASTRLASFRTGKIDLMAEQKWDDVKLLMEQCPEVTFLSTVGHNDIPTCRVDKEELPFKDLRVRQAMNLAVNQEEIKELYYEGHAFLVGWPFYPIKSHEPFYTPLEEMPAEPKIPGSECSVQELFEFKPDKAKQLLAEAGYPDGFKTKIDCDVSQTDYLAMIREYLLSVGIDMEIVPHEAGDFRSINRGRTHEEMLFKETKMWQFPYKMHEVRSESMDCLSFYENPRTREVYDEVNKYLGKDDPKWMKALKDITPFMLEDCVMGIWLPAEELYTCWWPWFQNFYGCVWIGYFTPEQYTYWTWIDTEMKEGMGY